MTGTGWLTEKLIASDIPQVLAIERDCFSNPWPREGFLPVEEAWWSRSLVLRSRRAPDRICGYICYWLLEGELEIQNIAVRRVERRGGGAWELMRAAMEDGAREGCAAAWLEVRKSNAGAIALYERWGFRSVGIQERYYEDGEDGLVMRAGLEGVQKSSTEGSGAISLKGPRSGC